jgi:membrane protein required for colicin V production
VEEFFSWAALVLGLLGAVFFYANGAAFIRERAMENLMYVPEILAFLVIFLLIGLVVRMLERLLLGVIMATNLGGANRVLGAVFGLIEGFALVALLLFVISIQPLFDPQSVIGNSIFAEILLPLIDERLLNGRFSRSEGIIAIANCLFS